MHNENSRWNVLENDRSTTGVGTDRLQMGNGVDLGLETPSQFLAVNNIAYRCIQTNSPIGVDRYQNPWLIDASPDHFISLAQLEGCSSRAKEFFVDRSR